MKSILKIFVGLLIGVISGVLGNDIYTNFADIRKVNEFQKLLSSEETSFLDVNKFIAALDREVKKGRVSKYSVIFPNAKMRLFGLVLIYMAPI